MDSPMFGQENKKEISRPLPVTLIALYEFVKAAYILYAFSAIWKLHRAPISYGQSDPVQQSPFVFLLPIFAAALLIAGIGLWLLKGWARQMFLFGGTLALPWLPALPMRWKMTYGPIVDYQSLEPFLPRAVMLTVLLVDALVYAVLIYYPDVATAFGQSYGDPYYVGESDD